MVELLDEVPENLEDIDVIKVNLPGDSQIRKKFEALRQDMKNASNNRKIGKKATVHYAVEKAFEALQSEENLYEEIKKTKLRQIN